MDVREIPIELINEPPFPMRTKFSDTPFDELCNSIRVKGILEPLIVRPVTRTEVIVDETGHHEQVVGVDVPSDRFDVVAGHRRFKAARVVSLAKVPCIVKSISEEEAVEDMIHENTGREEVSAAEEGWFYLELVERFKYNETQLCTKVKKSPAYVNERIDLVRNDPEIAIANAEDKISFSVAKELLRVNPHTAALILRCAVQDLPADFGDVCAKHRAYLLDLCVRSGATGRVARSYVEQWKMGLVPTNPYREPNRLDEAAPTQEQRLPRCLVCGRDADPQNFRMIPVHYWEVEGALRILKAAGMTVYE